MLWDGLFLSLLFFGNRLGRTARDPGFLTDANAIKEQVRARVDLVDLISQHTSLKRRGRNLVGLCPFHEEKTPSFSVDPDRQFFKCFGCGKGGDVFTFVQLRESVDFREALRILADRVGVDLSVRRGGQPGGPSRADIAKVNEWAFRQMRGWFHDERIGSRARDYAQTRSISREMVEQFGVGFAPAGGTALRDAARSGGPDEQLLINAALCKRDDRGRVYETFRDRLMFPIRDPMKRCIGFGGRLLGDGHPKYLNSPETALFDKSRSLYGVDQARDAMSAERAAIIVEGYTDCIAAHQFGFPNTVATLGTAATDEHMKLLRRYCDTVLLVFDADAAGQAAADRAIGIALRHDLAVKLVNLTGNQDPADILQDSGAEAFRKLLLSASDALVFKWHRTRERFSGASSAADRRAAVEEFVSLVSGLVSFGALDTIQQGVMVTQLSDLLSVPTGQVQQLLARRSSKRNTPQDRDPSVGSTTRVMPDGESSAMMTILTVLVHEPGYYDRVSRLFEPTRLPDVVSIRVGERVRRLAETLGEFQLSELLADVEDPDESALIAELAMRGEQMVDPSATVDGACTRLEQIRRERETSRLRSEAIGGSNMDDRADGDANKLAEYGRQLANRRGFAGRRVIEDRFNRVPSQEDGG